ncbi:MAG: hypothetical protein M0025_03845 [Elusimicrobia bacterium]|nr:hypothetical protein [Elusimicrobiota bacterium]
MKDKFLLPLLAAAAFALGSAGAGWDLPSRERSSKLLPAAWDRSALFDGLTSGWENIYDKAAGSTPLAAEAAGKYSTKLTGRRDEDFNRPLPPPELWNSYRSMMIRSGYPDEALPLSDLARMKPADFDLRPPSFLYGGGYLYPLGAYYSVLSLTRLAHPLPLREALERPDTLGRIYLAGRLLSAAAFAAVCLLVFLIARELQPTAAIYAWAAVMTLPLPGVYAHYLTPHLWSAAWGLTGIYFALCALPDLRRGPLLAAGACLGMATASYWSAANAAVLALAVILSPGRSALKPAALKNLGLAALAGAAVFLLMNPYLPFNLAEAAAELAPGGASAPAATGNTLPTLFLSALPAAAGPAFAFLLPAGCLWGLFSGRPPLRNLSAAVLLLAAPIAFTITPDFPVGVRRFFPWLTAGALCGSLLMDRLTRDLRPALRLAALIAALAPGLGMSLVYTLSFLDGSGDNSAYKRMAARLDSIPPGAVLGLTEFPQPAYYPAFRMDRWRLRLANPETMSALPAADLPEYMLVYYRHKPPLSGILSSRYALDSAFYPRAIAGFSPSTLIGGGNPPAELYRLKKEPR